MSIIYNEPILEESLSPRNKTRSNEIKNYSQKYKLNMLYTKIVA